MRKKLIVSVFIIVAIILMIVSGNQVIIKLFSNFSEKLITEYHELHSLQELKVSLSKSLTYLSLPNDHSQPGFHTEMEASLNESIEKMEICNQIITERHKGPIWHETQSEFIQLGYFTTMIGPANEGEEEVLSEKIRISIDKIIINIDVMVNETLDEITEYEIMNSKVVKHGTMTVLVFGTGLIAFLALGGLRFVKTLTRPIDQLVSAMKKISDGNTKIHVTVDSNDEFLFLAESFNSMLEVLNSTTVSKDFFSEILNNLYGVVIVTDEKGKITFINDSACNLLNCISNKLHRKDSISLFSYSSEKPIHVDENTDTESYASHLRKMTEMRTAEGNLIPVYVTCTVLRNAEGTAYGMVILCHDLTKEKANEEKLERIRKERLIAINEAEENERIRIAKDLHDGLGQILTGISYSIQNLTPSNQEESEILDRLDIRINSAIQEAKNISHNLTPVILRDFGLVTAIENLVNRTNHLKKGKFIFNSYNFDTRIDQRLEKALYRICQEGLNNIIKHAEARNATIELFRKPNQIVLVIDDNGKGFDPSKLEHKIDGGIGLISMRERAYVFDGVFTIDSKPGRGTEIMVEIPCPKPRNINGTA